MIVVVMPSRSRPERAKSAIDAIRATAALIDTSVVLVVDADDPRLDDYRALIFPDFGVAVTLVTLAPEETGNLVRATNTISLRIAAEDPGAIIGNLGDDHFCRTHGWDRRVTEALSAPGIAYGDDLLQGEMLPTAPFVSASIVNALGWYFLPSLTHMYVDNALKRLGQALGSHHYLPDIVIEHLHPGAGKAEMDDGYLRADASTEADRDAYHHWRYGGGLDADVAAIRGAIAA